MARIRTIKPEFWTSEQVAECSRDARLLFIGMWSFSDDGGRHKASHKRLKMEVFPGDSATDADIAEWIEELLDADLIREYEVDGVAYWEITGWKAHQLIDQPTYKHPAPCGGVPESSRRLGGKQRRLAMKRCAERDGGWSCVFCGVKENLTLDHKVPRSAGGGDEDDNLQLLCKRCNNEKYTSQPQVRGGDAQGTRGVRGGDAPPEGNGMEGNGIGGEVKKEVSSDKRTPPRFDPKGVDLPKPLNTPAFQAAWLDWCHHRTEIRKPLRPTSVQQQLRELADWGHDRAVAALRHTIAKGWQGIREPETRGSPVSSGKPSMDEVLRKIRENNQ